MTTLIANKRAAWKKVVDKAFKANQKVKTGNPNVVLCAGVPDFAALVGTLCWDSTNLDAYICTVAAGTWVKINA